MEHLRKLLRWTDGLSDSALKYVRVILRLTNGLSYPARILFATLIVAVAAGAAWLLGDYMAGHVYTLFLLAITLCALFFDAGTSIYALVLSCIAAIYLFEEAGSRPYIGPGPGISLVVYILASLIFIAVGELFRMLGSALIGAEDAKAALLEELRHRSRNYVQMVGAAVSVAAAGATQHETKSVLAGVTQRIEGFGHISAMLDIPDGKTSFDACPYFEELVKATAAPLVGARPITVICRAEAIPLERKMAELLGIAVNELVTNAVTHAFPDERSGSVNVEFGRRPEGGLSLIVSDNGIGCSAQTAWGTGLALVSRLVKMQGGAVTVQAANPGCRVMIRL